MGKSSVKIRRNVKSGFAISKAYFDNRTKANENRLVAFIKRSSTSDLTFTRDDFKDRIKNGIDDRYAHIIPIERQKIQISNTETLIRFIEAELESRKKKRKKNHGKHSR